MNINIFYFSGTGNTWWVSTELKKELEVLNNSVEMHSLENPIFSEKDLINQKINKADHIIIGYPVYGSDMPKNMRDFVKNLPKTSDNKKISIFCTQAGFSGDANIYFKKDLTSKGYFFNQSIQIDLTTNLHVEMLPFSLCKPANVKKIEKKKRKALKKIKLFADIINKNDKYIEGRRIYQKLLGGLQRHFFNKYEVRFARYFKFLNNKCNRCKLCTENCPANNWFFDKFGKLQSRGKCILCFRCYNFCPTHAINFGRKITKPDKYIRFKGPINNLNISDIKK